MVCKGRCWGWRARCGTPAIRPACSARATRPPPDAGVTPLGRSIPTAANGSVAPIAPDPSCQLRTIRALRDESFDVLHLHEPLVPGPTMTAILFRNAPLLGTFHAAGTSAAYRYLRPGVRWLAGRLDQRCAVSEAARDMAKRRAGRRVRAAVQRHRDRAVRQGVALEDRQPDDLLHRAPRAPQGPRRPARRRFAICRRTSGCGSPGTVPRRPRCARATPAIRGSSGSGASATRRRRRGCGAPNVFCAPSLRGESFGVVLLEAMAAQTPVVASDLDGYRNVARSGADAILVPPGDAEALAAALARGPQEPVVRGRAGDLGAAAGGGVLDGQPRAAVPRALPAAVTSE